VFYPKGLRTCEKVDNVQEIAGFVGGGVCDRPCRMLAGLHAHCMQPNQPTHFHMLTLTQTHNRVVKFCVCERGGGVAGGAIQTGNDDKVLDFVGTRPTGLQLAVFAFEDVPVRSRVAHRADPLD
jgi:hypothetical protein